MRIEETPEVVRILQLAEESSELSHASMKLARIQMGYSPTPVSEHEAQIRLKEEVADILVCLDALGISVNDPVIRSMRRKKWWRWQERLNE